MCVVLLCAGKAQEDAKISSNEMPCTKTCER